MFELSHLRVFLIAAEEQSFSRAAARLGLSQSAVSQIIQTLERAYDLELFERRGRSVVLSDAGRAILPVVREAVNAARLVEDALLNVRQDISGELLIGCSTSAGKYLLPILLADFQHQFPGVFPRVQIMGREMVVNKLLEYEIPFGVTSRQIDHSDLEFFPLFEDHIILIVPPDHPWAKFGHAHPDDLLNQPIITREESSGTREAVVEALRQVGLHCNLFKIRMELGNPEAIVYAVERGVGIAFVSRLVAARSLALGLVRSVEVEGLTLKRMIYVSRLLSQPMTRVQNLFWEYLVQRRSELQSWLERSNEILPTGFDHVTFKVG
ncbi:MAG: LysR family transcriptional regulator [Anaerolineales bacterium]|nr:LysR family transcriptional regulator [Anaerolineales bacterium]MCX7609588.1 LysR family transcriptional regulator [Anaerolineales bacterium]